VLSPFWRPARRLLVQVGSSHAVSKSDVENQIGTKMTDAAGNKPSSVTCPGDLDAKVAPR